MINKPTEEQVAVFMEAAVFGLDMRCPFCDERVFEADYKTCGYCGEPNPYKKLGLI